MKLLHHSLGPKKSFEVVLVTRGLTKEKKPFDYSIFVSEVTVFVNTYIMIFSEH